MNDTGIIKIALADDHVILLEGIKLFLEMRPGFKVTEIVSSGEELMSKLEHELADVAIIDINMAGINGLKTLRLLKQLYPQLKVIVLSMHQSEVFVLEAIESGADGYVFKSRAGKELIAAIEAVIEDGVFYSEPEEPIGFINENDSKAESEWDIIQKLTNREKEILLLLPKDLSTKQIAHMLYSSPHTIETHRRNLLRKVGVNSVSGLVNFALRNSIFLTP